MEDGCHLHETYSITPYQKDSHSKRSSGHDNTEVHRKQYHTSIRFSCMLFVRYKQCALALLIPESSATRKNPSAVSTYLNGRQRRSLNLTVLTLALLRPNSFVLFTNTRTENYPKDRRMPLLNLCCQECAMLLANNACHRRSSALPSGVVRSGGIHCLQLSLDIHASHLHLLKTNGSHALYRAYRSTSAVFCLALLQHYRSRNQLEPTHNTSTRWANKQNPNPLNVQLVTQQLQNKRRTPSFCSGI